MAGTQTNDASKNTTTEVQQTTTVAAIPSQTKRPLSPYDLFSSDNPGNLITQVQLKGDNFDEWARAVRGALRARRKYGFIDGSIEEPTLDSLDHDDWLPVNSMIASWIYNTIDPQLRPTITYVENAKALWDDLQQRFSIANGPRLHQLKADLANCKQDGGTVITFYGKLKKIWDELADLEALPVCDCTGCKCAITATLTRKREEEKVHQFLMGLDDTIYKTVRSHVLNCDPLPSIGRVYQMVTQEERVGIITRAREDRIDPVGSAVGFAMRGPRNGGGDRSSLTCTHCSRGGHDVSTCFRLHGYPEWWGDRPRVPVRGKGNTRPHPYHSGSSSGGTIRGQAADKGKGAAAHAVQVREERAMAAPMLTVNGKEVTIPDLDSVEWQEILEMINSRKGEPTEKLTGPHKADGDWYG